MFDWLRRRQAKASIEAARTARFDAVSPWPPGAASLYAWRAARPIRPDLEARRPAPELLAMLSWPVERTRAFSPLDMLEPRAQSVLERDAGQIAAAARDPSRRSLREACAALAAASTAGERARLGAQLVDAGDPIASFLGWIVKRTPEIEVLESAVAVLSSQADASDLEIVEVLAGQGALAESLVEIVERADPPTAQRAALLLRIGATSHGQGRAATLSALAPHAREPQVARWLVRADTADASLESMLALAGLVDFGAIDSVAASDPGAAIGWLHLFARWFEDGRNSTTFVDGIARIGPPPPFFAIPHAALHFERLLARLESFALDGAEALEALAEASRLHARIRALSDEPAAALDALDRRRAWQRCLLAWMAQPAHRAALDRALSEPPDGRIGTLTSLAEDIWGDDPWPPLMAALRAGRIEWLWTTLWKTKTAERMEQIAEWAQRVLAIDDDGLLDRAATPLAGIEQPGVRMGGIAAFQDAKLADGVRQTLGLVLGELKRFSGVGAPLVCAALRCEDEMLEVSALRTLETWSETDRAAVMDRLPRGH